MSDMRTLLESMNKFAGQAVGQKPGDQVRGTEKAKPSKKGHPFKGRLVGGESADTGKNMQIHIANSVYEASRTSKAGVELRNLYNELADDFDGDEVLGRFDSYVDNLSDDAQALYRQIKLQYGNMSEGDGKPVYSEDVKTEIQEAYNQYVAEYGAGRGMTAMGGGADEEASPRDVANQRMQQSGEKDQVKGQIGGLVAQLQGSRAEMSNINRQFPQGANPVEKAMSLQQMSAQKNDLARRIEDLSSQIAALRPQAI